MRTKRKERNKIAYQGEDCKVDLLSYQARDIAENKSGIWNSKIACKLSLRVYSVIKVDCYYLSGWVLKWILFLFVHVFHWALVTLSLSKMISILTRILSKINLRPYRLFSLANYSFSPSSDLFPSLISSLFTYNKGKVQIIKWRSELGT